MFPSLTNIGENVLHKACSKKENALLIIEFLISLKKIDLESKDNNGQTVLFYACCNGNLELFQLLQKFDYDNQDSEGKTILHYACNTDNIDLVQFIISLGAITTNKDNQNSTILHCACQNGNFNIVHYLVNRGELDINAKDIQGNTPYSYAYYSEKSKLIEYLESLPDIDLTVNLFINEEEEDGIEVDELLCSSDDIDTDEEEEIYDMELDDEKKKMMKVKYKKMWILNLNSAKSFLRKQSNI